jgi:NhaA family Na+:H+ antiporter
MTNKRLSKPLSKSFTAFFNSEKASGLVLIGCTVVSMLLANSPTGLAYFKVLHSHLGSLSIEHWINDGLMAIFFLHIGLELERELYNGELSNLKQALLPVLAAVGGICLPALIHFALNAGTATQAGMGIPMATDIAFAIGVLALLGSRVPTSLKVFLTALAVIDDLGAIIIIAVFYTAQLSIAYLAGAISMFCLLLALNRFFRVTSLVPYLVGGVLLWFLMLKSGVHATIAGVLLAFTIPFSAKEDDEKSPSHRLEHWLNRPVTFLILPIFALANTGITINADSTQYLASANSVGVILGLVVGKPLGITLVSFIAVVSGLCTLPLDLNWRHIIGAGLLGGIGFTMSVFITNLAFVGNVEAINTSKLAIVLASLTAGVMGCLWLRLFSKANT